MEYRRARVSGGRYFFTVVTYNRKPLLCLPDNIRILRKALDTVMAKRPFVINAAVVLPDHIHCIWTLPFGDYDFSTRWRLIKTFFTQHCKRPCTCTPDSARFNKNEQTVWQRRFWEHLIRDERDMISHVEYIHYNPVKHGYVEEPAHWMASSFQRYVTAGLYEKSWGKAVPLSFEPHIGYE